MKNKALILAGDHWHDPQICFDSLGQNLAAEGVEAETTRDYAAFGRYMLRDKQLFILHRDGVEFPKGEDQPSEPWMRLYQEEVIENFVLRGGGFLAFHNSGWGYPWQGAYRRVLGGYYIGHPPMAAFNVLGAQVGTRLAIRRGSAFVRGVFVVATTVLIAKFGHDTWLTMVK